MTLIATPKANELEATIPLLPLGLSSETKVWTGSLGKASSKLQGGEYKGWIEMEVVASCLEEIGNTVKDISAALGSEGSCPIMREANNIE